MSPKLFLFLIFLNYHFVFPQSDKDAIQKLKNNNDYNEYYYCNNSTALVKAEYYYYNYVGYVVIYFKENIYDSNGTPYLYCNISRERWNLFINQGKLNSWGVSYHNNIESYKCGYQSNSISNQKGYEIQAPQESVNVPLVAKALKNLDQKYKNGSSTNNYSYSNDNMIYFNLKELNYRYSFGLGYGSNILEILTDIRIGKKTSIQTQFNKFLDTPKQIVNQENYKKQFGISTIYNYNMPFFSDNFFFVTGFGISYSKIYVNNLFENKIQPIINIGLNYNMNKIPISLGIHSRIDFGNYSNTGISLKYIYK